MDKLISIVGPTASGKTQLAISLAQKFNAEIVSCDSMQIYKYMNIGTAKVSPEDRKIVPHFMIDIIEPTENYNVYEFVNQAREHIADIIGRGKIPILVGGTGLYMDALLGRINLSHLPNSNYSEEFRSQMNELLERHGKIYLHSLLLKYNKKLYRSIEPNDVKKVIRALERCRFQNIQTENCATFKDANYNFLAIGLEVDRNTLYDNINNRVDGMLKAGLAKEVEHLISLGVRHDNTSIQAIGYKQLYYYIINHYFQKAINSKDLRIENFVKNYPEFFTNSKEYDSLVNLIKQKSRNYAKRQYTWFRSNESINWINQNYDFKNVEKKSSILIEKFLNC